jgi:hypothetical protein
VKTLNFTGVTIRIEEKFPFSTASLLWYVASVIPSPPYESEVKKKHFFFPRPFLHSLPLTCGLQYAKFCPNIFDRILGNIRPLNFNPLGLPPLLHTTIFPEAP